MEFEEWMAEFSDPVQQLARAARRLILELLPEAQEQVDPPSRLAAYSVGPKMNDVVFTLLPLKAALNLGVFGGVALGEALRATAPEAAALLQGSGKRHRHVRISRLEDLRSPVLRTLLAAAVAAQPRP